MVLAWFPITSSWNTACYIRGLIHGIGRGVPNGVTNDWYIIGFTTPQLNLLLYRILPTHVLEKQFTTARLIKASLADEAIQRTSEQPTKRAFSHFLNLLKLYHWIQSYNFSMLIFFRSLILKAHDCSSNLIHTFSVAFKHVKNDPLFISREP